MSAQFSENKQIVSREDVMHIHQSSEPVAAVTRLVNTGTALDGRVNLAKYAERELCGYAPHRSDDSEFYKGSFVLLSKLQKEPQHKLWRGVEESALRVITRLPAIAESFKENERDEAVEDIVYRLHRLLPDVENPQINGCDPVPKIGKKDWVEIMDVASDEQFDQDVGEFLFNLAANPQPVHGRYEDSEPTKKLQVACNLKLGRLFQEFYSAADKEARISMKVYAAQRIMDDPANCAMYNMIIEGGRTLYRKNKSWVPTWMINIADALTDQPHTEAYEAALSNKTVHPPYFSANILNS